jgi:hypothetical protein
MIYYFIIGFLILVSYKIIKIVKVPPELKNTPAVPLFTFFRLILDKQCFRDKMDHYLQDKFNEFGVIRVNFATLLFNF